MEEAIECGEGDGDRFSEFLPSVAIEIMQQQPLEADLGCVVEGDLTQDLVGVGVNIITHVCNIRGEIIASVRSRVTQALVMPVLPGDATSRMEAIAPPHEHDFINGFAKAHLQEVVDPSENSAAIGVVAVNLSMQIAKEPLQSNVVDFGVGSGVAGINVGVNQFLRLAQLSAELGEFTVARSALGWEFLDLQDKVLKTAINIITFTHGRIIIIKQKTNTMKKSLFTKSLLI